jgi:hypothetical protein
LDFVSVERFVGAEAVPLDGAIVEVAEGVPRFLGDAGGNGELAVVGGGSGEAFEMNTADGLQVFEDRSFVIKVTERGDLLKGDDTHGAVSYRSTPEG